MKILQIILVDIRHYAVYTLYTSLYSSSPVFQLCRLSQVGRPDLLISLAGSNQIPGPPAPLPPARRTSSKPSTKLLFWLCGCWRAGAGADTILMTVATGTGAHPDLGTDLHTGILGASAPPGILPANSQLGYR